MYIVVLETESDGICETWSFDNEELARKFQERVDSFLEARGMDLWCASVEQPSAVTHSDFDEIIESFERSFS